MNDLCSNCRRELNALIDEEHAAEIQAFFDQVPTPEAPPAINFELDQLEVAAAEEANNRIDKRRNAA